MANDSFFELVNIYNKYIVYLFFIRIIYLDSLVNVPNLFSVHFEVRKIKKEIYFIFVCLFAFFFLDFLKTVK